MKSEKDTEAKSSRPKKKIPNYHGMSLRVYQLIERERERNVGMGVPL